MPKLKLFLLGAPNFELDGRPVEIARRKAVALMAYLVVNDRSYTRDELATLFWPDYEPAQSYAYLRRSLWEINNVLGKGWLDAGREQVGPERDQAIWLDVTAFEAALASAKQEGQTAKLANLATAVSLYRGEFMAGFSLSDAPQFDMWQRFTGERLSRHFAQALERLVSEHEQQSDFQSALTYAERWLSHNSLHEPAHRALMRQYATLGQRAAAIRQYESLVAILEDELAVEPEPETIALHDQIARGDWPASQSRDRGGERRQALVRSTPTRQTVRLPVQPTRFVGRTDEIKAISTLLTEPSCQLLSLTGPGGSGKTRLAIRVAEQLVEQKHSAVADGAYFVGLAPLMSSDSIGSAIGKSLGGDFYQEGEEPRRQLIDYLRHKHLLLILDNFEHLIGNQSIDLLGDLMGELVDLKVMVTSRIRLNVRGERLYPVAGMKTPNGRGVAGHPKGHTELSLTEAESYSALRLFRQSARQVKPAFELTIDNLPSVIRVCQSVEGLPLAIELAAGWAELLSVEEIAAEIERGLDFLESELQDMPGRQRSIRAVFEYSWQLLDAEERRILERLSVFRGGFDRQAAGKVGGATLRKLLSLTNKSWLQQNVAGRFQIHELLRQYTGDKLQSAPGAWQQANEAHAAYYAGMLTSAGREMNGQNQLVAIEQVADEFDNISAAWRWYAAQGRFPVLIEQMLPGLYRFSETRSTGEEFLSLIQTAAKALRAEPDAPPDSEASAILLTYEIRARLLITYWDSYQTLILRAWSYAFEGDGSDHYATWLVLLAEAYSWQVDRGEGARELARLAEAAHGAGDPWGDALASLRLADIVSMDGHYVAALQAAKRAQRLFRELGDVGMQAHALRRVGSTLWKMGDYDQAEQLLLDGRELFRAIKDPGGEAEIIQELHEMSLMAGRFDRAFEYFAERREIARAIDHRQMVHESLHWESMQAARFGDLEHARQLRLESLELARKLGDPIRVGWATWEMGELLRLEGDLVAAGKWYRDSLRHFKESEHLLGIAFYNRGFGDIALLEGDMEAAKGRFELYLSLAEADNHHWSIAYALNGLGRVEVALGNLGLAEQHFRESFQRAYVISRDLCMMPVYGLASILAASNMPQQALELAVFVADYHLSWHETRRLAQVLIAEMHDSLADEEAKQAVARGRQRDLDSVIDEFNLEAKGAVDE